MIYLSTVCEDVLSEFVVERIISSFGTKFSIAIRHITDGNVHLRKSFAGYNEAAKHSPFFILTDLDRIQCPPQLIAQWKQGLTLNEGLIFRIAVTEIESWILADRVGFSSYAGVRVKYLPSNVDALPNPKQTIINLVKDHGRKSVAMDIVPRGHASVGPNYNLSLATFVNDSWNLQHARSHSKSLDGCIRSLEQFNWTGEQRI